MSKEIWDKLKTPPPSALKSIGGGRLKGMTDINPQWRYEVMTEVFGPCGIGWRYSIDKMWTEPAANGEVFAFSQVSVSILLNEENPTWSAPVPGIGGSMLIAKETSGLHANDEAFKMATTDALSVALKMLGVASDIYQGRWDGTKYVDKKSDQKATGEDKKTSSNTDNTSKSQNTDVITEPQRKRLFAISQAADISPESITLFLGHFYKIDSSKKILKSKYKEICEVVMDKTKFDFMMNKVAEETNG